MSTGIQRLNKKVNAVITATFERIRGIVTRAKARFSKAFSAGVDPNRNRINDIISQAVAKAKQMTSLAAVKETLT